MLMRVIFIWAVMIFAVMPGCGGSFQRPQEEKEPTQKLSRPDTNPLDLPEDNTVVPQKYPMPHRADSASAHRDRKGSAVDSIPMPGTYESYRIQIFNSKTYGPAVREMNIAREIFDQKIWLDYEVPYYKVRVGDFADRRAAEDYLPKVKSAGYNAAWVVRVNVNLQTLEESRDETPAQVDSLEQIKPSMEPSNDSTSNPPH
ncbi:hypothetical protein TRIP_C21219 [Candidatus Zixiibacteriota bacterium]|nr:hypothetical protein TRIP_C21219 [candidate division Zixibacteria bacterium]